MCLMPHPSHLPWLFFLQCQRPSYTSIKNNSQITVLYYFQFYTVKILSNQTVNESAPNGSKHAWNVICLTCLLTPIFSHNYLTWCESHDAFHPSVNLWGTEAQLCVHSPDFLCCCPLDTGNWMRNCLDCSAVFSCKVFTGSCTEFCHNAIQKHSNIILYPSAVWSTDYT